MKTLSTPQQNTLAQRFRAVRWDYWNRKQKTQQVNYELTNKTEEKDDIQLFI